ncbi:ATP-binding protein [Algoriphagus namhaensis]|uniref:histidine kinase n=1 Tax=Algoriphagus namhaensis TaxID=915353 RepID=A0ABV8AS51_9BACT
MEKNKKRQLEETYQRFIHAGLSGSEPKNLVEFIDQKVVGFGTAIDEKIRGIEEVQKLLETQKTQSEGLTITWKVTPVDHYTTEDENTAIFVDEVLIVVKSKDQGFEFLARFSIILEYIKNTWKIIHWHGSKPEEVESEKDTWGIDMYKQQAEKLQKLVDEKTTDLKEKNRELEIETALERIRAKAMAMHHSTELSSVVDTLLQEFTKLDFRLTFCIINLIDEQDRSNTVWAANPETGKDAESYYMKFEDYPFHHAMWDAWKAQEKRFVYTIAGEEKKIYDEYLYSETEFRRFPKHVQDANKALERYVAGFTFFEYSGLQTVSEDFISEQDLAILERFGRVFEQAYTRFLDLKKAEEQAREAEIELALERVRARTMSMQTSEELADVAFILFEQLRSLGGNLWGTGFGLCEENSEKDEFWFANDKGIFPPVAIPNTTDPAHKQMYQAWKEKMDFLSIEKSGKNLESHYEYMLSLPEVRPFFQKIIDEGLSFPEKQQWNAAYFSNGYLLIITLEPYPEVGIFKRFAKVFEQSYTRFIDLQKAEAQAREAQIVASLERVRAATMAMHQSNELGVVLSKLFEQFDVLGIKPSHAVLTLINQEKNTLNFRTTGKNGYQVLGEQEVDLTIVDAWLDTAEKWKKSEPNAVNVNEYPPEILPEVWEVYKDILDSMPKNARPEVKDFPDGLFITEGYCKFGYIGFAHNRRPTSEEKDIVRRIAAEFGSLYQRFLDLQKAEAQTREAQIQLALERVRARAMAMQNSEELADLSQELVKQVKALGVETWFCAFNIYQENGLESIEWGSNGMATFPRYKTPRENVFLEYFEAGQKGETLLINEIGEEECPAHYEYLCSLPGVGEQLLKMKEEGIPFPKYQIDHVAFFKFGYILFITYDAVPESHEVFKRFAREFEQAYTRFLDLKKAEAQAREAQIEAALERIRSRSMGMQKSEDLAEVVRQTTMEIMELGIQVSNTQIGIDFTSDPNVGMNNWVSVEGQRYLKKFHIPYIDHPVTTKFYETLGNDLGFFTAKYSKSEKNAYFKLLFEHSDFKETPEERKNYVFNTPGWIICSVISKNSSMQFARYSLEEFTNEEIEVFKRFGKVFEQAYTRFLDLQKAEDQAREAQIEAALERVRSRTMGMQKAAELGDVAQLLFGELNTLVDDLWTCGFVLCEKDQKEDEWWLSLDNGLIQPFSLPNFGDFAHESLYEGWVKGETYRTVTLENKQLQAHYDWLMDIPIAKQIFHDMESSGIPRPNWQRLHAAYFKTGYLVIITEVPCEGDEIFKRFAQVFDQTYTRFLDLHKAEAQARDAQIEAAMERIRSRALAMHSSDGLKDVIIELRRQIDSLGELDLEASVIHLYPEGEPMFESIAAVRPPGESGEIVLANVHFPVDAMDQVEYMIQMYHSEISEYTIEFNKEMAEEWQQVMVKHAPMIAERRVGFVNNRRQSDHSEFWNFSDFSEGSLLLVTHSPASIDTKVVLRKAAAVFDIAYRRFRDLQKAEAQAREAQINLAVERVRARALAMNRSEKILDVVYKLKEELMGLDISGVAAATILLKETDGRVRSWDLTSMEQEGDQMHISSDIVFDLDTTHPNFYQRELWAKGEAYRVVTQDRASLKISTNWLRDHGKIKEAEEADAFIASADIKVVYHPSVPLAKGRMVIDLLEPPQEEVKSILTKMAAAFDLAYKRFEDLQKAEAQTREAKVELSLERIRAQVTAMRESSELFDIVVAMRKEFITLGHEADYFWHMKWTEKSYEMSMTSEEGDRIGMVISIPKFVHDDIPRLADWEKSDSNLFVLDLNGPEAWDYIEKMNTYGKYEQVDPHAPSEEDILAIGGLTFIIARTSHGEIGFSLAGQVPEPPQESLETLIRFAKVFGIAYKRFEDLKKAEEQAKEAKVELSLERIRAQVTAMRESEELLEIVVTMRKEFVNLGHEAHYFWHMRWLPDTYAKAMTSGDGTQIGMVMSLPRHIHGDIPAVAAWEKSNEPTHILAMDIDLAVDYVDKMIKLGDFERVDPQAPTLDDIRHIGGLTFVMARTTHGEIGYSLPGKVEQPPQESIDTLTRFAGVFDLAYRRFEDLLTSEKQNRKAKIELALERVRARAMAMQEPEELVEVAQVLREEMGLLGVEELETSSIYINQGEQGKAQCWYSIKDIREGAKTYIADHFDLNYKDTWVGKQMLDFYQSDQTNTSILMQGEHRIEWINYCAKRTKKLDGYYGNEIPERTYHLTKFSNGAIGAATPGEISPESWELLRRAATVFSLAYSRFRDLSQAKDDLKKLKRAKAKAEKALKELKAAQEQLVQQEKLASLGQLTAGIAHEIKNPLNFVNNFSDLSRELIEEVFEELENIEDSAAKEEIIAILNDVKGNLSKVYEHGSRADSIVKSMLQHSRASGSKREAKAFNPMVQEFVNLSFHGMRAGKAPINVEIDLQLDPKVGEVDLISEDFSRVILNLCNNAFDAMRDKLNSNNEYQPKLTVKTAVQKDKVLLSIGDNGGGVPKEIQDKILQPFFTTKKGTEGTGLGLSITHDIIKAHGGEIQIHSEQDSGATFIISLSNS